jgi:hypothetical protein
MAKKVNKKEIEEEVKQGIDFIDKCEDNQELIDELQAKYASDDMGDHVKIYYTHPL